MLRSNFFGPTILVAVSLVLWQFWSATTVSGTSFSIKEDSGSVLSVMIEKTEIIRHSAEQPFIYIGQGMENISEFRGNFKVKDYISQRRGLPVYKVTNDSDENVLVEFSSTDSPWWGEAVVNISHDDQKRVRMTVQYKGVEKGNRLWMRFVAEDGEHFYGGGEQYSYFDLSAKNFPLWTREQGVGRNKSTLVTWMADVADRAGGDYHTTYYPQPAIISSRRYYTFFNSSVYMNMDFDHGGFYEFEVWSTELVELKFDVAENLPSLVGKLSSLLGRQPVMPDWVYNGLVLGLQGGTNVTLQRLKEAQDHGIEVSAVWIQDWSGQLNTSFGQRIYWNWMWSKERYPDLDTVIQKLQSLDIQVLTYINPYLINGSSLYKEADSLGFFVKTSTGKTFLSDFGEFYCGTVDLTNAAAFAWYKEVIKSNMIRLGLSGWMADFGEYLPVSDDLVFSNGQTGSVLHNLWPLLWARLNREAVEEMKKVGEVMFWSRSGFSGSQRFSTMVWAGDQCVDFSLADGLASVIPAALSLSVQGVGLFHFDIGGYTSYPPIVRTQEMLLRSAEMAVFTPMMRTHEGNQPRGNWQYYTDSETLTDFGRLSRIYKKLAPYTKELVRNYTETGIGPIRPLFLHYESDPACYGLQYQYMYGRDLLVAPVIEQLRDTWSVYLPADSWVSLWFNQTQFTLKRGETVQIKSPVGYPPVFYRKTSEWKDLFESLKSVKNAPETL